MYYTLKERVKEINQLIEVLESKELSNQEKVDKTLKMLKDEKEKLTRKSPCDGCKCSLHYGCGCTEDCETCDNPKGKKKIINSNDKGASDMEYEILEVEGKNLNELHDKLEILVDSKIASGWRKLGRTSGALKTNNDFYLMQAMVK